MMTLNKHFGASPGPLPPCVWEKARKLLDDTMPSRAASVLDLSSRDPLFKELMDKISHGLRRLLRIPSSHEILLTVGTARMISGLIPLNLIKSGDHADYLVNGHWSQWAAQESQNHNKNTHQHIFVNTCPKEKLEIHTASRYLYYCDNETAQGIEFPEPPLSDVPLIADMSSNLVTRPINWKKFGLVYASAQKILFGAGLSLMIIRHDWLGKTHSYCPTVCQFQKIYEQNSQITTLPVFNFFVMYEFIQWLEKLGSLEDIDARCREKSQIIYEVIDQSTLYDCPIKSADRSRINICFSLKDENTTEEFLSASEDAGFYGLRGHRFSGGVRISIYNPVSLEAVYNLKEFLLDFEKRKKV